MLHPVRVISAFVTHRFIGILVMNHVMNHQQMLSYMETMWKQIQAESSVPDVMFVRAGRCVRIFKGRKYIHMSPLGLVWKSR